MFEREIKFIYDFNLNKVKKAGSFLTYEQLLAADLHPAIMQYISAEIDYLIFEDRQKMLKNSVFDYSGGKITQYFNLINQEVKKSKRFSSDYISKLILHASSFTVNFLIRPKWSLLKFIFDEEEHKSAAEIKQILNYLYYYGYLKNILISYLDKKKILSMNKEEFVELLDKIEKLGIETYLDDVINTALKSMAEFFNIGSTQKTKVPLPGIHIFLKEKKLSDHINRLNETFSSEEKLNYEITDVQKVLLSVNTSKDDAFEELLEEEIADKESKLDDEVVESHEEKIVENDNIELESNLDSDYKEEEFENSDEQYEYNEKESLTETNEEQLNGDEVEEKHEVKEQPEKGLSIDKENIMLSDPGEELIDENNEEKISVTNKEPEESNEINDEKEFIEDDVFQEEVNNEQNEVVRQTQSIEEILEEHLDTEEEEPEVSSELSDYKTAPEVELNNEDDSEKDFEEDEPSLFGDEDFKEDESETELIDKTSDAEISNPELISPAFIDMSEILENKNMTKIIENIFDYDMEDFANTIDMISECPSKAEALALINELFDNNNIKSTSKEAETFKSIISEYFDKA